MLIAKKIQNAASFQWGTDGAVIIKARSDNFGKGYVKGEIGMVVFGYAGMSDWVVVMSGGHHTKGFKTFKKLFEELSARWDVDFLYIEIK